MSKETIKFKQKNWTGMTCEVTFVTNENITEFEIYDYQFQAIKENDVVKVFNSESSSTFPNFTMYLIDGVWGCICCGIHRENEDFRVLAAQIIFNLY